MSIISIESIYCEDEIVYVTAVVEDAVCIYQGSYYEPPEYESALCEASFYFGEGDLPESDEELTKLIEDFDPEWRVVDCSDY